MKHSESIVNISKALLAVQKEIKNMPQTAYNPFYKAKYAPLPDTLDTVRPLCNKYGLLLLQEYGEKGVSTMIIHPETGEWIAQEAMTMGLDKDTPQGAGSAYTYGRRYQLAGFFGYASEEDDDGNSGEKKKRPDSAGNKVKKEFNGTELPTVEVMKMKTANLTEYSVKYFRELKYTLPEVYEWCKPHDFDADKIEKAIKEL